MLDEFAECLARNVDAGEQLVSDRAPSGNAAVEVVEPGVAGAYQDLEGALGQPIAIVAQHDAGVPARHQASEFQLQAAQRHRAGEQQMALRKDQFLAQVDDRKLLAVGKHGFERRCLQCARRRHR